jgi:hypothetical protein
MISPINAGSSLPVGKLKEIPGGFLPWSRDARKVDP